MGTRYTAHLRPAAQQLAVCGARHSQGPAGTGRGHRRTHGGPPSGRVVRAASPVAARHGAVGQRGPRPTNGRCRTTTTERVRRSQQGVHVLGVGDMGPTRRRVARSLLHGDRLQHLLGEQRRAPSGAG
eukprot:826704-Prymnesium_polylepis.1